MTQKLYVITVLPSGYGEGKIVKGQMPHTSQNDPVWEFYPDEAQEDQDEWQKEVDALPKHLIHPDLKPESGKFIEHWEEGWEMNMTGKWELVAIEVGVVLDYPFREVLIPKAEPVNGTLGKLLTEAMTLHELNVDVVDKELRLLGNLRKLMNDQFYPNSIPVILFKNLLLSLHIPFDKAKPAMFKTIKLLIENEPPYEEQDYKKRKAQAYYENEEALTKYVNHLEELMSPKPLPAKDDTGGDSVNFMQTVPDSHSWTDFEMLLRFLEGAKSVAGEGATVEVDYLIVGLKNSIANSPTPEPVEKENEVRFYIDEVHALVRQYNKKEISISKLTELLNDKINGKQL